MPIAYRPTERLVDLDAYHRLWDATRNRLAEAWGHPVRLEIEPGRYLVAESGYLLTQIRAIKQTSSRTFYILDAGFNNLARPILYGAYHPMSIGPDDGARKDLCKMWSWLARSASLATSSLKKKAEWFAAGRCLSLA